MKPEKIIIFDASSIISLAMNGLYEEFKKLKKEFKGKFIIPREVREETIEKPMNIKKFELEAIKINQLLKDKIIEMPESIGIDSNEITKKTKEDMKIANSCFSSDKKDIHLIDLGETACLVLSRILNKEGIKNVVVIDERTTRNLIEFSKELKKFLEKKLHTKLKENKKNLSYFRGIKLIRSCEIVFMMWKKGFVKPKSKKTLGALLYGVKYRGCSISKDEISEIKKLN